MEPRETMIEHLQWNDGGMGYGICSVGNSFLWSTQRPQFPRGSDDLKSIVVISTPPEKYTDEDLQILCEFSDEQTAQYDEMFLWRLGADLICLSKHDDGTWTRKRMSWEYGPMYSPTLEEALNVFRTPALATQE